MSDILDEQGDDEPFEVTDEREQPLFISRNLVEDRRLSWSAIGVMIFIQAARRAVTIDEIVQASTDTKEEVLSYIKELKQYGYL